MARAQRTQARSKPTRANQQPQPRGGSSRTASARTRKPKPVPQTGARAQQKQETQQRIVAAARDLFEREGYAETTTDAIARAAGVAKGTVFVHARDKLDLLMLVMHDELQATVRSSMQSLPQRGALVTRVMHVFRSLFEMYAKRERTASAFLTQHFIADGPNSTRLDALTFAFLGELAGLVRSSVERGELAPDVEPTLVAGNFFAIYLLSLLGWASKHLPRERALTTLEASLQLQVRGLLVS